MPAELPKKKYQKRLEELERLESEANLIEEEEEE